VSPTLRHVRESVRPTDVDRMVKILKEGGVIIAPTDTVYGLLAKAFTSETFERLDSIKGERRTPYAVAFADISSLEKWYGGFDLRQKRVIHSLLPGPVTLILKANRSVPENFRYHNAGIGVRVSSDELLPLLCKRLEAPIWASSANRSNDKAPIDFGGVSSILCKDVDMTIDSGPTTYRDASTVVDLRSHPYQVLRKGPWLERIERLLMKAAEQPVRVLVLCSGNTCRSPLAATWLQYLLGPASESGVKVSSAGLDVTPNEPVSSYMSEIATKNGFDLTDHLPHQVDLESVRNADLVLFVSALHRERIFKLEPSIADKSGYLGQPIGLETIPDPYDGGDQVYNNVADLIERSVLGWVKELSCYTLSAIEPPGLTKHVAAHVDSDSIS
jgi:tRNA threonylcarbamoyl adenosine modification protein (Sua5/YciO/YrdC/YwlC family)